MARNKIISIAAPFGELERKYTFADLRVMVAVYRHILKCRDEFVTLDHPDILDDVPKELLSSVSTPIEITPLRKRLYFTDKKLLMPDRGVELRQEIKANSNIIRQVIKIDTEDAQQDGPTLNRMEYPAKLSALGPVMRAIRDKSVKRRLVHEFGRKKMRSPIRMISQRFRFPYHPEGDRSTIMEIAFDPILVGQCFDGFSWTKPIMELEIKDGPEGVAASEALLNREETRLMSRFEMVRHLHSNPSPGFAHLQEAIAEKKGRRLLSSLPADFYDWRGVGLNGRVSREELQAMRKTVYRMRALNTARP